MTRLSIRVPACKIVGGVGYLALRVVVWWRPAVLGFAGGWPALAWAVAACVLLVMPLRSPVVNVVGLIGMVALTVIEAKAPALSSVLGSSGLGFVVGLASFVMTVWEPPRTHRASRPPRCV